MTALAACSETPTVPAGPSPSVAAADRKDAGDDEPNAARHRGRVQCDADNGGLTLPPGFCAVVVADNLGAARHMAVTPNGDLFVAINQRSPTTPPPFGILALRDVNGDGKADVIQGFNAGKGGSGIEWGNGRLYFGENDRVLRYRLSSGSLMPSGAPAVVVAGLPDIGNHISKTLVLRDERTLFVNIGSATNSCQILDRVAQSPGIFPCPELPIRAGVWVFNPLGTNQTESDGQRFATGYRNMVALDLFPRSHELFGVQHGRDNLFQNWPQFYTAAQGAALPAEEFVHITRGSNNGWPYCYFDAVFHHQKMLAPEYGGDGTKVRGGPGIDCASYNQPLATFGAHWAPNGLHFYAGHQFPRHYRNGAFIAFHGGFNRAPLPNEGFNVTFVPMTKDGRPSGPAEVFADNFAMSSGPLPATAKHRPVGVTEGPDGSVYISDDKGGRIWRVIFVGTHGNDDDRDDSDR
ncbi:MAG: PQQ-dependent sugar dehydrogenase [Gemmatimonadaceae bacterium]